MLVALTTAIPGCSYLTLRSLLGLLGLLQRGGCCFPRSCQVSGICTPSTICARMWLVLLGSLVYVCTLTLGRHPKAVGSIGLAADACLP